MPAIVKGLCQCGCGQPTTIVTYNNNSDGSVKGQPRRFIRFHHLKFHQKGAANPRWEGDDVSYGGIHSWLMRNIPKQGKCSECGATPRPQGSRKYGTEWHNLSGKYQRNTSDWIELCKRCHSVADQRREQ